nr:PilZ domain-containing protein [Neiella litorisoli]
MDRRQSLRLDMEKHLIELSWTEQTSEITRTVMCFDVSGGGLQVEMDRPLSLDTAVKVKFSPSEPISKQFEAKVIRVTKTESGWFNLGLIFTNKSQKQLGATR